MQPICTFAVTASLPARLERLRDLAYNLRWAWNHATIELFRRLDADLWETSGHNPVLMLGMIDQTRLEIVANDEGFLAHLEGVVEHLDRYMSGEGVWYRREYGATDLPSPLVAYFSAEFGVTECLSIFAGGLGVLAGDHLKSASDLGVPLIGVGLLYQEGYFHQYLNDAGWQQERYSDNDFHNLPLHLERHPDGSPLMISVSYPGRTVLAQVWRAQVGRVPLYLLDTNVPGNQASDRDITDQLYGGDLEMRLKQEIMLGIGGYRAVQALGLTPTVYHINEGHSAFLALERIRCLLAAGRLTFAAAREAASAGLIFTTHTPVAAGHDYFPPDLMRRYFTDYMAELGLSESEFLALGRRDPHDDNEAFCMTMLALRLAAHSNGVSRLHGQVSRQMWQCLWPGVPENEVPIGHVTNGVHFRSWISREMNLLYDRYLGPRWQEEPGDQSVWQRATGIAAEELWRTHERRRERLVSFVRGRLRDQLQRRGAPAAEIEAADEVLDPEALTIGFARRFATYKRATLLLRDPERLVRLLNHPQRPVQIIFAGKAHPHDDPGKELIRQIVALSRRPEFRRRLVFVEGYDVAVARYLVQGADVWLNTPCRPREASGTSGMKAAANAVLNLSTLDGWWDEAYSQEVGWAIGRGEIYADPGYQDQVEAEDLYELLEREVVPAFYDRGEDGLPRRWLARMKATLATLCYFFNTHRMVREYTERFYVPAATRYRRLVADDFARAQALAQWRERVQRAWPQVRIHKVEDQRSSDLEVGHKFRVQAWVELGELSPEEVGVELYSGRVNADGEIVDAGVQPMAPIEPTRLSPAGGEARAVYLFAGETLPLCHTGLHGYTVRVRPRHPDLAVPWLPGLITWRQKS